MPEFEEKRKKYEQLHAEEEKKTQLRVTLQKLNNEKRKLSNDIKGRTTEAASLNVLKEGRDKLLDELGGAYLAFYTARQALFSHLTSQSCGKLQLSIQHATNKTKFRQLLASKLSRTGAQSAHIQAVADNLSPRELERVVLSKSRTDLIEQGHRAYAEDTPSISFHKDDGTYAPLSELSVGQKCTALLIIALSKGDFPVIIDQPEDALDIKTVGGCYTEASAA